MLKREADGGNAEKPICSFPQLVDGVDDVAAGLFNFFELEKLPLLGFEQQLVKGAEAMGALVEARVLPLDRFLHQ